MWNQNLTTVYVPSLKHILKHLSIEMDTNLDDCYCMDFGICMFIVSADVHRKSLQNIHAVLSLYLCMFMFFVRRVTRPTSGPWAVRNPC